jgi:hypothetical protein
MKFLQIPELEFISQILNFDTVDSRVFGRIEAYSCKSLFLMIYLLLIFIR